MPRTTNAKTQTDRLAQSILPELKDFCRGLTDRELEQLQRALMDEFIDRLEKDCPSIEEILGEMDPHA